MRLFISITPAPDIVHELIRIQKQIQQTQIFDATYVKPENFHATLLFFGTVAQTKLDHLIHMLNTVQYNQFTITLSRVELYQDHDNKHAVLWVTLDSPELAQLADKLAHVFGRTTRPFIGHITLARIKKLRVSPGVVRTVISQLTRVSLSWTATSIELQQSVLTAQGPTYTLLARTSLH